MEADFWHNKWKNNEIGFHQDVPNPLLIEHIATLKLSEGARIFLPLCGKSVDIGWLLLNGYRVVGAELSELAIAQLFAQMNLKPQIRDLGEIKHYQARNIDIFVGDIFHVSQVMLGPIDAIFDRAALVALPNELRIAYAKHLIAITDSADQLLITFDYDDAGVSGPPHSISGDEINKHYAMHYNIVNLAKVPLIGGIKGKSDVLENVWHLKNKAN